MGKRRRPRRRIPDAPAQGTPRIPRNLRRERVGQSSLTCCLTKLAPVFLMQLDMMFLRSGLDAFPRGIAFGVSHAVHLLEAGDGVAHVSSVMNGFLAFLWESEILIGN